MPFFVAADVVFFCGAAFFVSAFFATGRAVLVGAVFFTAAFWARGAEPFGAAFFATAVFVAPFGAEVAAPFLVDAWVAVFWLAAFGVAVLFMLVVCLVDGLAAVFCAAVLVGPAPLRGAALPALRLRSACRAVARDGAFPGSEDAAETAGVSEGGKGAPGDKFPGSVSGSGELSASSGLSSTGAGVCSTSAGVCSVEEAGASRPSLVGASVSPLRVGEEASAWLSRASGSAPASERLGSKKLADKRSLGGNGAPT